MTRRLILSLLTLSAAAWAQPHADWHNEFPAFKIAGNLYYVGTADLAVYLINTPAGNILINSDFDQDIPLIRKSIESLGFRYADTKILLISHAHSDHDGGIPLMKKQTGARLMVMAQDVASEKTKVDRVLHDGDTVELGGSTWTAHLTPGHTKGCTTWTSTIEGKNVVIVGSPNVNSGYYLVGKETYPGIAQDFVKGFSTLKSLPCDIFLGAHGEYFGLKAKYERYRAGDKNAFEDPAGYKQFVAEKEQAFHEEWARAKANPGTAKP